MTTYYKAIRPDGTSFHDPSFAWATKPGGITRHTTFGGTGDTSTAAGYLSVSTTPTDCTGMRWPCRLLEVESLGDVFTPELNDLPNKRAALAFRTVRELPATDALGPQGVQVAALIERCAALTAVEMERLDAAWDAARVAALDAALGAALDAALDAARVAALDAARVAARDAALDAAWDAARVAAWDAAWALVARDLIGARFKQAHYDLLTGPWRKAIDPIHPDDGELS